MGETLAVSGTNGNISYINKVSKRLPNGSWHVSYAQQRDSGLYTCVLNNTFGVATTGVTLNVATSNDVLLLFSDYFVFLVARILAGGVPNKPANPDTTSEPITKKNGLCPISEKAKKIVVLSHTDLEAIKEKCLTRRLLAKTVLFFSRLFRNNSSLIPDQTVIVPRRILVMAPAKITANV